MGHPYSIEAEVITGRKVGRTVNVPTANLRVSEKYVKIKKGVYGVIVTHNGIKYRGIANYGHNPTFNFKEKATLEIHLLDFNGDLYGETIKVEFMIYLRDEVKFNSKEEFVEQINKDISKTKEIIKTISSAKRSIDMTVDTIPDVKTLTVPNVNPSEILP